MSRVGTTGPLHAPKLFKVKLGLMNIFRANFTKLGELITRMALAFIKIK